MAGESNPLGMSDQVWDDMSAEERACARRIDEWDLSFLTGDRLMRQGIGETHLHDAVLLELKRMLTIKILRDPEPFGCFGPMIAAAWHEFILHTERYEEFCQELYGKTIHHRPSNYGLGVSDNSLWISIYHEWFGKFHQVWKLDKSGQEIAGYEHGMNVMGNISSGDMDSDDGAFGGPN